MKKRRLHIHNLHSGETLRGREATLAILSILQLQEPSSQFNKNLKGCGTATNQPTEGETAGERARHRQGERERERRLQTLAF